MVDDQLVDCVSKGRSYGSTRVPGPSISRASLEDSQVLP